MQINLLDSRIKEVFKVSGWALLFIVLWFKGCSNDQVTKTKVIVTAVSGKFKPKKPESKPLEIKQEPISEVKKDGVVYIENPLNKKLLAENEKLKLDFAKQSDSLKQKSYEKAIELNSFHTSFEDKYLKLQIDGIVRGEVQEVTPSYEIKEREIEAPIKETYLRVFIGTGFGLNTDLNRGLYKFDLDFMNKKGDVFSGEYLRVNGQDFGVIGIKKSILNLKR